MSVNISRFLSLRSCVFVAVVGAATSFAACTTTNDVTATQCRSEEDCRARGPEFAETTCSADRVCVPVPKTSVACSTNQECSDKNLGAPYRCITSTGQCVPLTSPECPRIQGERQDYLNDNAIFYGVSSLPTFNGTIVEFAADLARSEIRTSNGGGLPGATPAAPKRPLVGILCQVEPSANGLGSASQATRALRHLSEVVKVAAIVGPALNPTILENFDTVLKPNKVASFLNLTVPGNLGPEVNQGLLVKMIGSDVTTAKHLQALITNYLEPRVRTENIAPAGEPIRVQFIFSTESTNIASVDYNLKNLKFNGQTILENGANFKATSLGDVTDRVSVPNPAQNVARAVVEAAAFKPHIVVITTPPTLAQSLLIPLEAQIPAPKPIYVSTIGTWQTFMVALIGNRNALRQRYMGLQVASPPPDPAKLQELEIALKIKFPELSTVSLASQNPAVVAYDSLYAMSYAIVAAGAVPIDGAAIAQGLKRMTGGTEINVGPTDFPKGVAPLQAGGSIMFKGVSGDVVFDADGLRRHASRLFCVKAGPTGVANAIQQTTYEYSTQTSSAAGDPDILTACP